ncbi:hypothetical protein CPC08DRAFT_716949 [Agrocybe pediades]|nr:hypothetical protein CPC08DRAFT_716949 [Agrocybe pediades]
MAKWAHMEVVCGAGGVDGKYTLPITSSRPQPSDLKLNPPASRALQSNCNTLNRLRHPWPLPIARCIPLVTHSISSTTPPSSPDMISMVTQTPTAAPTMGPKPLPAPLRYYLLSTFATSIHTMDIPSTLSHAGVKHDARKMLRSQRSHGNGPAHR